jgi:hypothetical protein
MGFSFTLLTSAGDKNEGKRRAKRAKPALFQKKNLQVLI